MTYLDKELKDALRRQPPPDGFTEGVLARAATQESPQPSPTHDSWLKLFTQPVLRWAYVATLSAALLAGGIFYRHLQYERTQRERAEGEAAKQQLMLALRIAGSKLQLAKSKVNEMNMNQSRNRQVKE